MTILAILTLGVCFALAATFVSLRMLIRVSRANSEVV